MHVHSDPFEEHDLQFAGAGPTIAERLQEMRRPFPPEKISKLTKRYKNKLTGEWNEIELDYVGHADITARLLDVDPLWSWEPVSMDQSGQPCLVIEEGHPVGLWIRLRVLGVARLGYGSCEPGKADAVKELIGDAIRNAAMRFGAGLELWSKSGRGAATETPSAPKGKPEKVTAEVLAKEFGGALRPASSLPQPGLSKVTVLGIAVDTTKFKLETAKNHVIGFGKHKGKTMGALLATEEGRGYIEWMATKAAKELREGARKSYPSDFLTLLVYDSFQPTAPVPGPAEQAGDAGDPFNEVPF